MHFTIRNYRPEDFRTLLGIDHACFARGIAYSALELRTYIQRRTSFTLVAEQTEELGPSTIGAPQGERVIGFLVGERTRSLGHIITIDVVAEARRHKVGSALLGLAERQLQLWSCPVVQLETAVDNTSALAFYKRHRYHVIQTIPRYYSNGVDALLLEKHLLSPPSSS